MMQKAPHANLPAGSHLVGQQLDHYQILSVVGYGGMGVVYRARQQHVNRDVALKVIAEKLASHPGFRKHFEREARTAGGLQHPHVLPVYDMVLDDGLAYMVMPYMPGGSLAARISLHPGGISLGEAICITSQVSGALDYLHAQGMLHRDFKPGNILLDEEGNAYISDFGLARLIGDPTKTGKPIGTREYMAPEVAAGLPGTHASDIYSLGVIIFEMLNGHRPTKDGRIWHPGIPREVVTVVEEALRANPAARPSSAALLSGALTRAAGIVLPCHDQMPPDIQRAKSLPQAFKELLFDKPVPISSPAPALPEEDNWQPIGKTSQAAPPVPELTLPKATPIKAPIRPQPEKPAPVTENHPAPEGSAVPDIAGLPTTPPWSPEDEDTAVGPSTPPPPVESGIRTPSPYKEPETLPADGKEGADGQAQVSHEAVQEFVPLDPPTTKKRRKPLPITDASATSSPAPPVDQLYEPTPVQAPVVVDARPRTGESNSTTLRHVSDRTLQTPLGKKRMPRRDKAIVSAVVAFLVVSLILLFVLVMLSIGQPPAV